MSRGDAAVLGDPFDIGGVGPGLRLAVKDAIDVAGRPTTLGSPVVAETAGPASADAACVLGATASGAVVVAKTNLHELCFGATGVNPWFGTPENPCDPARIPGGSSSGSAVAVAVGTADVALGTDTGGSVRNPAACCGVVGLKTTWDLVPRRGVADLAPSLDTVGCLGADVAAVARGARWLIPGLVTPDEPIGRVGRLRTLTGTPAIESAVDAALAAVVEVVDVVLPGWDRATDAATTVLFGEALATFRDVADAHADRLGDDVRERFVRARAITGAQLAAARAHARTWRAELDALLAVVDVIALPTLLAPPPLIGEHGAASNRAALAVNLAGHPALALPVGGDGPVPASLQLVGPHRSEARLLALAAAIESQL